MCSKIILDETKAINEFENIFPGGLTSELIRLVSNHFEGQLGEDLLWLSIHTKFFTIKTFDNLTLQGYYIPAPEKIDKKSPIVYAEGFTESTIKYTSFLRILHNKGHSIFALDHRGQGFSEDTGFDNGRIFHVESFVDTLVKDLEIFISDHVNVIIKNNVNTDKVHNFNEYDKLVFLGNSMGALIGLKYASLHPEIFSKMILISPCFGLTLSSPIILYINALRLIYNGSIKLTKLPEDISSFKITKDPEKHIIWQKFRKLLPKHLYVEGPSIAFMDELYRSTRDVHLAAGNITSPILIFLADEDDYVSIDAVYKSIQYFNNSPEIKLLRYKDTYHELLHESDAILNKVSKEIEFFLN